jgi:hypothetical protein
MPFVRIRGHLTGAGFCLMALMSSRVVLLLIGGMLLGILEMLGAELVSVRLVSFHLRSLLLLVIDLAPGPSHE